MKIKLKLVKAEVSLMPLICYSMHISRDFFRFIEDKLCIPKERIMSEITGQNGITEPFFEFNSNSAISPFSLSVNPFDYILNYFFPL